MFKNIIRQIPTASILVDRAERQRSELAVDSVLSLAVSIGRSQWISPILIDEETNYLIAGERRLTAVKVLAAAMNGDYSEFSDPVLAREMLFPICTCKIDSWENWTKIPAQIGCKFTPSDLAMYEFIENAQRKDLPWQDQAKAIYDVHAKSLATDKNWTAVHTANLIGIGRATVTENLRLWRMIADEDAGAELKTIIAEAPTLRSAMQTIERYTSRRETGLGVSLSGGTVPKPRAETSIYNKPGPKPLSSNDRTQSSLLSVEDEPEPAALTLADSILVNTDFTTWAPSYAGEPFNFIHCDFPYGIDFNKGEYTTRVSSTILCKYDDSEDVYWKLLNTLRDNLHIIAPQAHIVFWYSQNFRRETEDFFTAIGGIVQPFNMIWHCPNEGIVPDPQRYGRRSYETAMLVTFGDRKIVAPRDLSIQAPRETKDRIHRSQKPIRVLEDFFEMFVDNSSVVLDPTCGSGTSLIAANNLKARHVIGLEKDTDIYKNSYTYINSMSTVRL